MTHQKWYLQKKGNVVSKMNGETVMFNMKNGSYYNIGSVGGDIWEKLMQPVTVDEITSDMIMKYDIEVQQCYKEVEAFLKHLIQEELVEVRGGLTC
ncbi:lasso peptide biosynthesis PqqD family chaperone [Alkalicoccus luteus]|uniref:Lasso peptide biosynthesis PqqD family chaperone n=1 Tax=Alkalicoccus luteus TaxID=1237094 RepID=A0A969PYS5_9BACI|nr:lasso peptide biosynthesis PqqD family chaperone [Alkalicoccus luteus]NJP38027.1 lasso peptide biosynthesis PqqD family chaperone [Alkalicoccus luteus]